jgi:hypothetical protein
LGVEGLDLAVWWGLGLGMGGWGLRVGGRGFGVVVRGWGGGGGVLGVDCLVLGFGVWGVWGLEFGVVGQG